MKKDHKPTDFSDIGSLLFWSPLPVRIVNFITLYRIVTFPLLVFFALRDDFDVFKWLLLASFFTDAIDGFLARKYKATSVLGAKLDSVGDDLTIVAAVTGLFMSRFDFIEEQVLLIGILIGLFVIQVALSFYRYKKITTFHTYLAKIAAIITGMFLLSVFFLDKIYYPLFYASAAVTGVELVEEIVLVVILKDYRTNIGGLYWVLKHRNP